MIAGLHLFAGAGETIRSACEWLAADAEDGGAFSDGWPSGAGGFLSDLASTALCVSALEQAQLTSHRNRGRSRSRMRYSSQSRTIRPSRFMPTCLMLSNS